MTTLHKTRILHIEKDSSDRLLVRLALAADEGGVTLLEAEDGLSGLAQARQEVPDIVLLDIVLPGINGYEVATRLKSSPSLCKIPVVALTALCNPGDRERALAAGCDGYIQKPIHAKHFAFQLREYIEGKREVVSPEEEGKFLREISNRFAQRLEEKFEELAQAQESLRESERLTSKFIALAAHELRTPVTIIQGYLGILLDAAQEGRPLDSAECLGVTGGLNKGVIRLSNVIDDIMDAARLEADVLQLYPSEATLADIVRSAVNDLRVAIANRRQRVNLDSLNHLPKVWLDTQRMYQVFVNVVENAIKYTPDGGQINVSGAVIPIEAIPYHSQFVPQSNTYIDVTIQDNGVGIAADDMERIFRSFYEVRDGSLHSTSKYQFLGGGIGLGLAIARGIVKKHGGWLWAESTGCDLEKCPGSCFHVVVPVHNTRRV